MRRTERLDRRIAVPLIAVLLSSLLVSATSSATGWDNAERIEAGSFTDAGVMISQRVFPDGADAAVVVRDDRAPDALASSALAAKVGGPVLFTATDQLTPATRTELDRILDQGDTVYLAGGPQAIAPRVEAAIKEAGYQVTRLWGETRVETAGEIARFVGLPQGGEVLVARAFGPPEMGVEGDRTVSWVDSVSCGGYANHTTTPILLTHTGELTPATAGYVDQLSPSRITVCGGPAAVGDAVVNDLRGRGHEVRRVWGDTRVTTAVEVAKQLFGYNTAAGGQFLLVPGYGDQFGYGLAATPLSGQLGAPILLVDRDQPTDCNDTSHAAYATLCYLATATNSAQTTNGSAAAQLTVVGNSAQVSDGVVAASAQSAGGKPGSPPSEQPLPTPSGVSARNDSAPEEGRVRVSWQGVDDPHSRLAGYNVYYGTSAPSTRAGNGPTTVAAGTTRFTVEGLLLDTTYRFAVTSVTTDGRESAKSSPITKTTTPPHVRLTAPTTENPTTVEPSQPFTVRFDYTATEGGTYQLFRRAHGASPDTAWTPFGETPASSPGSVTAGSGSQEHQIHAPGSGSEGTYDLRVVLTTAGGATSVHDIEARALSVERAPDAPVVTIDWPTQLDKARVAPGDPVEVAFTASEAGTYELRYRPSGTTPWLEFEGDEEASGPASQGGNTATVTAPGDGTHDLRVTLVATATGLSDSDNQSQAIKVETPPSATVQITAPTTGQAFERTEGDDNDELVVEFEYTTDEPRDYRILRRLHGSTAADWTLFADADATGDAVPDGAPVAATVTAPGDEGSYDLRVELTPQGGGDAVAWDEQDEAIVVHPPGGGPTLTIESPLQQVDPEDPFTFTFHTTRAGIYKVEYRVSPDGNWLEFVDDQDAGGSVDDDETKDAELTAPSTPAIYDLQVTLWPTDPETPESEIQTAGLTVRDPDQDDEDDVTITNVPGSVVRETDFDIEFDYDIRGNRTYQLQYEDAQGEWNEFGDGRGNLDGPAVDAEHTAEVTAPPETGEYQVRIRLFEEHDADPEMATQTAQDDWEEGTLTVTDVDCTDPENALFHTDCDAPDVSQNVRPATLEFDAPQSQPGQKRTGGWDLTVFNEEDSVALDDGRFELTFRSRHTVGAPGESLRPELWYCVKSLTTSPESNDCEDESSFTEVGKEEPGFGVYTFTFPTEALQLTSVGFRGEFALEVMFGASALSPLSATWDVVARVIAPSGADLAVPVARVVSVGSG